MQPPHERRDAVVEEYLKSVEARLKALPAERREEELAEIRQHLHALAAGHRAQGMSETEAAEAAVRRFGRAERIGGDLRKSWDQREGKLPVWLAGAFFLCLFALVFGFFTSITGPGDFPYQIQDRLLLSLVFTAASFSITRAAHQYRKKAHLRN